MVAHLGHLLRAADVLGTGAGFVGVVHPAGLEEGQEVGHLGLVAE